MTDPLTEMLASLKEKLRRATPGPWRIPGANIGRIVAPEAPHTNPPQGKCPPYPWAVVADTDSRSVPEWHANAAYIAALDPDLVAAFIGCVEALERIHKMDRRAADWDRQHNVLAYADGPCGQLACDALAQLRKLAEGRTG